MKTMKMTLSVLLAMAVMLVSACSSSSTAPNAGTSGGTPAPAATDGGASPNAGGEEKEEPAALERKSIEVVVNNVGRKFPDGMDENNNPYIDYIRENTNLDITLIVPPADGYMDTLNVIMSSGDLPDMISTWNADWVENYIRQKGLQPLDDALAAYGQDLLRNIPEEAWKQVTYDGKIYAVPGMNAVLGDEIVYIRKDWLDNLGLEPPRTLEEYKEVMRAFATQDPDGNGEDDTYGFTFMQNLGRAAPFFGAFGIQRGIWMDRDGKLVNTNTMPEMKEALGFLAELHKEKLIDPEWALNTYAAFNEKIISGKVGFFVGAWHETRGTILNSKTNDPEAEWITLGFPEGPNGHKGTLAYPPISTYNVVPVTSDNADAVVRMLNFMNSDGYKTLLLGFENEVWKEEDGKIVTNFDEHNKHIYRQTLSEMIRPYKHPADRDRLDSLGLEFNLNENVDLIHEFGIPNEYMGNATPGMGKHSSRLGKLEEEYFTKIVVGQLPLDAFDDYVEEWKKNGGDEITAEVNAWYEQNK